MIFDFCIGNPPYQGENHQQLYPDFYIGAQDISNFVDLVFPIGWQEPKDANNLKKMNNASIKEDVQIILIDNCQNIFPKNVTGAEWTNIILWKKGYNNELNGDQKVLYNGKEEKILHLNFNKEQVEKPIEIIELKKCVLECGNYIGMNTIISSLKPYGLRTDFLDDPLKYELPRVYETQQSDNDIKIYGLKNRKNTICYLSYDYPIPKITKAKNHYKVLIGKAWGNFSEGYIGGSYADIIIAYPNEVCTENFLECGCYATYREAIYCAKYVMTKFVRALLYLNKFSHDNSKDKWVDVPIQDYTENYWDKSIFEINNALMDKYNVPQKIRKFVEKNIQTKTEKNIINYDENYDK